jgi:hypothetical protein
MLHVSHGRLLFVTLRRCLIGAGLEFDGSTNKWGFVMKRITYSHVVCVLVALLSSARAATYYVSQSSGNHRWSGKADGEKPRPWKTLAKASIKLPAGASWKTSSGAEIELQKGHKTLWMSSPHEGISMRWIELKLKK